MDKLSSVPCTNVIDVLVAAKKNPQIIEILLDGVDDSCSKDLKVSFNKVAALVFDSESVSTVSSFLSDQRNIAMLEKNAKRILSSISVSEEISFDQAVARTDFFENNSIQKAVSQLKQVLRPCEIMDSCFSRSHKTKAIRLQHVSKFPAYKDKVHAMRLDFYRGDEKRLLSNSNKNGKIELSILPGVHIEKNKVVPSLDNVGLYEISLLDPVSLDGPFLNINFVINQEEKNPIFSFKDPQGNSLSQLPETSRELLPGKDIVDKKALLVELLLA